MNQTILSLMIYVLNPIQRHWLASRDNSNALGVAIAFPSTGFATVKPTAVHPFPVSIPLTRIPSNVSGYFHHYLTSSHDLIANQFQHFPLPFFTSKVFQL